ncbi:MAG: hypothetical protein JOZ31_14980 [Verrucomicrobia bacterium]|nr:hypothetical protein [Verrucomicrobiota bacterium]MBV8483606.1 hypothetical protein [Verrucomicrobiota bacterium]
MKNRQTLTIERIASRNLQNRRSQIGTGVQKFEELQEFKEERLSDRQPWSAAFPRPRDEADRVDTCLARFPEFSGNYTKRQMLIVSDRHRGCTRSSALNNALATYPKIDAVWSTEGCTGIIQPFLQLKRPLVPMTGESDNGFMRLVVENISGASSLP